MSARAPARRRIGVVLLAAALALANAAAAAPSEDGAAPEDASAEPAPSDAAAPPLFSFGGPIELQDVFLPTQLRPQSYPESAAPLRRGEISVRAVTDWTNHLAKTDTYLFDGESVTTTLKLRFAPIDRLELGVDLPWTSRFDGTLDPFIEDVETSLDARVKARFELPRFNWTAIVVAPDGKRRLDMPNKDGFGDLSLRAKLALARSEELGFDAALVATLGLPTGQTSFGGDGLSPGLGLHLQRPFRTVNLFAGGAIDYYSDATDQSFRLAPWRWMTYLGGEWRPWRSWLGLVAEGQIYGPIARTNPPLTHPSYYYAGGLRLHLPARVVLEATVVENLGLIENRNSSDVTFHFGLGWTFRL